MRPFSFLISIPNWLWPRLLLAGLVAILVFGSCGSTQFLRSDRRARPLVVRYTVERNHLLYIFGLGRDTIDTEFRYNKVPLVPPSACLPNSQDVHFFQSRRLPGPEPRWLMKIHCHETNAATDSVFLLRVPASGPVWLRVGAAPRSPLHAAIRWLPDGTALWLAGQGETGTLVDLNTMRAVPTWLPAMPYGDRHHPIYLLSPDRHVLARVHSPDTTTRYQRVYEDSTWQTRRWKSAPWLIISEYNLITHNSHNLTLEGTYVPPAQLSNAVEWTHPDGRQWTLRLRQPKP